MSNPNFPGSSSRFDEIFYDIYDRACQYDPADYYVWSKSESNVIAENDYEYGLLELYHEYSSLADDQVETQTRRKAVWSIFEDRSEKNVEDIFADDVACFFMGADENYVTKILEDCGFNPEEIGTRILRDRSLLKIVNGGLWMNDILQELGWKIAKGEFPDETAKWSRPWSYKDIQTVKTGTENVEGIVLSPDDLQETPLKAEALSQMSRLRLIIFLNNVKFSGNLNGLSNELRLLSWSKFPFSSLPSSFEPDKLVELIMHDSNIIELWEGEKRLPNLRSIDLRGSESLIKTPNVKGVANLERLDLEGCTRLSQVDLSVGDLKRIKFLNLRNCHNLTSIPNTLLLSASLETLNLSGCYRLAKC